MVGCLIQLVVRHVVWSGKKLTLMAKLQKQGERLELAIAKKLKLLASYPGSSVSTPSKEAEATDLVPRLKCVYTSNWSLGTSLLKLATIHIRLYSSCITANVTSPTLRELHKVVAVEFFPTAHHPNAHVQVTQALNSPHTEQFHFN